MTKPTIHIALAIHDHKGTYWPYVVTTLTSVFMHSSSPLHVHLLHDHTLGPEASAALAQLCRKYQHQLTLHPITLSPTMAAINTRQFSVATLYRLVLPQLLRHLDLVIYLDADLIFNEIDISVLVNAIDSDPHQHPVSAVVDDLFALQKSGSKELEMLGIPASQYFNAGMLGLRPQRIDLDLVEALQHFMLRYPEAVHIDQDLLNQTFAQRVHWLPARFNHQVNLIQGRYFDSLDSFDGKILHFTGKTKPLSGTFAMPDLLFWRYTHEVPQIHRFIQAPMRYLQQMHTNPSAAKLIPTRERQP
jgi:lipopolysaccharide biosynthesis glycosyltransferase